MSPRTSPASRIRTLEQLSPYLAASPERLELLADALQERRLVHSFEVSRGRRTRMITVPTDEALKHVHRRIVALLTGIATDFPPHVTGYVRGRSTFANALPHAGSPFMQRFDLADFFGHVTRIGVEQGLISYGFSENIAPLIARLVSVGGILPTGFATSPAMANVAMADFDKDLARLVQEQDMAVTRYADDIAFSASFPFDLRERMSGLAESHGHELNTSKTRTLKHGQPLYVTGLSVAERDGPRLPKPFKRRVRQELHYINKFGLVEHSSRTRESPERVVLRLGGRLAYARSVEAPWVDDIMAAFPRASSLVFPPRSAESEELKAQSLQRLADRIRSQPASRAALYTPTVTYVGMAH